jgi:2-polyprenyl-3-methyl-5-hydroxy-6-metoxy-1,4-benzoquinol methylase
VRSGTSPLGAEGSATPDHPIWPRFARAMGAMQQVNAADLAALVQLPAAGAVRVLDVSASHGQYGIAFARRSDSVRVVALDWPSVLAVTREHVEAAGLSGRFGYLPGSAFDLDWGGDYDLVLLPDFLHHFDRDTCAGLLAKTRANLRPGGQVAIVEFMPNDDRVTPPALAVFVLNMLVTTPAGDVYTVGEIESMLRAAGFRDGRIHVLPHTGKRAAIAHV